MADVSQLIGQGVGFSPGSVKFIVTDGLGIGVAAAGIPRSVKAKVRAVPRQTTEVRTVARVTTEERA